jgi:hypothetical protein
VFSSLFSSLLAASLTWTGQFNLEYHSKQFTEHTLLDPQMDPPLLQGFPRLFLFHSFIFHQCGFEMKIKFLVSQFLESYGSSDWDQTSDLCSFGWIDKISAAFLVC